MGNDVRVADGMAYGICCGEECAEMICKQCGAEVPKAEERVHYHGRCKPCALAKRAAHSCRINPKPRAKAGDHVDLGGEIKPQYTLEDVESQINRVLSAFKVADERKKAWQ
jgi:hypothetical protein